jgi:hypothetical protein
MRNQWKYLRQVTNIEKQSHGGQTTPDAFIENTDGKCPHCQHVVCFKAAHLLGGSFFSFFTVEGGSDTVKVYSSSCPNCHKPIVVAIIGNNGVETLRLVHPSNPTRTIPPEVPKGIAEDFREAAAVIQISEKASAALSRRCLQSLLADKGYVKRDLSEQIDDVLPKLPSTLAENLDAVRNIGNFAAHALKHQSTGLVVDVEPEEANWNLEVLEALFDHFYVQPKLNSERRAKLNAKLASIGKSPMKTP